MTDPQHEEGIAARLKADADRAAFEIDEQYRFGLCRLVEQEMSRRFRRLEDPEDVVQSAFRTFFRRNARGEFHFDSSADLWRLLATITRRKILKHVERLGAGKRDPGREVHAEGDEPSGREPTPEEAALAADLMEKVLADFNETYAEILHLRLQNCTEREIAEAMGCNRNLVRVKLDRIRRRLESLMADGET